MGNRCKQIITRTTGVPKLQMTPAIKIYLLYKRQPFSLPSYIKNSLTILVKQLALIKWGKAR